MPSIREALGTTTPPDRVLWLQRRETWAGDRIYFTTSLLANWDKPGKDDEQFLKAYGWDGKKLTPLFTVDFKAEKLGRPHLMRFGQEGFYKNEISESEVPGAAAVVDSVAARER